MSFFCKKSISKTEMLLIYKHAYLLLQLSELMNSCAATEILSDVYINVHKRKIYKHDNLFSSSEGIRTGRLRPKLT